ncbi:MAG: DUF1573 domain-containing protein, partial [Bacteroidota bacterium]
MRFLFLFILFSSGLFSQNSAIMIDEKNKDIGTQENIYKVRADYIIQNKQAKNLYLLRADAEKGITIRASKKTLHPDDTSLIVVEFIPKNTGKFNENIHLVTSADGLPYDLSLSGTIKSIKTDDKTACFYFKKPNTSGVKETQAIVVYEDHSKRDNSNKMPDNGVATNTPPAVQQKKPESGIVKPQPAKDESLLNPDLYKPNNIVFLVDVSSSMKDSAKLPVMQYAMQFLIEALRPTDVVTLVSYADSVRVLKEGISGANKKELLESVAKLKARGLTK